MTTKFDSEERKFYKKLIIFELKRLGIRYTWKGGYVGWAFENKVIIPRPIDTYTLGHCFHEMGHIVKNHWGVRKKNLPSYIHEYEAEIYAINKLKKYRLKYIKVYEAGAITYVLRTLMRYKDNHPDFEIYSVPNNIIKWCGIKKRYWNESKNVIIQDEFPNYKYQIKIKYNL